MNIIETVALTKDFGGLMAVDRLSVQVGQGEVFGLLGPNGAGKTTTLSMLCTILKPSSGTARVNGFDILRDPTNVRKSIGIVFQDPTLDNRLTGRDNLTIHADLYDVPAREVSSRIETVASLVGLTDRMDDLVKTYSGGMRRRLEIARGLVHTPKVLFLDEPTLGLDPQTRSRVWEYLDQVRRTETVTVVLTTHYMEEAESLCDRIAIIDHGKVVALDTPRELTRRVGHEVVTLEVEDSSRVSDFRSFDATASLAGPGCVKLSVEDGATAVPPLLRFALERGIVVKSVEVARVTLNDVFMHFVGRQIREEPDKDNAKHRMRYRLRAQGRV